MRVRLSALVLALCLMSPAQTIPSTGWVTAPTPIIDASPSGFDSIIGDLWIVKNAGIYYGFYGANGSGMGLVTSTDLNTWTRSASNPILARGWKWDLNAIGKPAVVYFNGIWRMYYEGGNSTRQIGLATNPDITNHAGWYKAPDGGGIIAVDVGAEPDGRTSSAILTSSAYIEDGVLYMFYTAQDHLDWTWRIYVASSTDGATFTKLAMLLESPACPHWDCGFRAPGNVVKTTTGYLMTYNAGSTPSSGHLDESGNSGFGFATAPALLGPWTAQASPVVSNDVVVAAHHIYRSHITNFDGKLQLWFNAASPITSIERIFRATQGPIVWGVSQ